MPSVKIERDFYKGLCVPFYPECPYGGDMQMKDGEPNCTHPKGKHYACSIHHHLRNKGTEAECPFDLHEELYGDAPQ